MKYLITVLCAAALLAGCTKKKSAGLDAPESAVDQAEVEKLKAEIEASKAKAEMERLKAELADLKAKSTVDVNLLQNRNGVYYLLNEEKPFTGVAVEKDSSGQKKFEYSCRDGKLDGLRTRWHKNGQKDWETAWKDGNKNGLASAWHGNGQKWMAATYKDGKRDGLETWWYEDGQKKEEGTYKDGKLISKKKWGRDGNLSVKTQESKAQKPGTRAEATKVVVDVDQLEKRDDLVYFKEVPFTGVAVSKYSNGQKEEERTFKAGELISFKGWDKDGDPF